ncbi:hypothetical protein OH768_27375 [Streptomyces sp. NBC_01622]|nr:hypothetical protein OH768_27375 [Streptomyces sp. NBC_01622]
MIKAVAYAYDTYAGVYPLSLGARTQVLRDDSTPVRSPGTSRT